MSANSEPLNHPNGSVNPEVLCTASQEEGPPGRKQALLHWAVSVLGLNLSLCNLGSFIPPLSLSSGP